METLFSRLQCSSKPYTQPLKMHPFASYRDLYLPCSLQTLEAKSQGACVTRVAKAPRKFVVKREREVELCVEETHPRKRIRSSMSTSSELLPFVCLDELGTDVVVELKENVAYNGDQEIESSQQMQDDESEVESDAEMEQ